LTLTKTLRLLFLCGSVFSGLASVGVAAERKEKPDRLSTEQAQVRVWVAPRTPDQMSGFYEARGFSQAAIKELRKACIITISILHQRQQIVWLLPDRWRFIDQDGRPVRRYNRRYWRRIWERIKLSPASQATFGWSSLPESRDLRYLEPVGGNITLRPTPGKITLIATFPTGADKKGPSLKLKVPGLTCPGHF